MRRLALALGATGAGLVLMSLGAVTASAEAPIRVGWWNSASSNGAAAPSPTTPTGGIRVSAGSGGTTPVPGASAQQEQVLAYGAVLYEADEGTSGTLTLKVAGSAQGTPQVVACPTRSASWSTGDDQPAPGPAYDCNTQHFPGTVAADGSTVTFHISAELEPSPGQLSLAILPDLSSTALPTGPSPFAVDFSPPDATSFTALGGPEGASAGSAFNPSYVPPPPGSAGGPLGLPAFVPPQAPAAQPPGTGRPPPLAPKPSRALPAPRATQSVALVLRSRVATAVGALFLLGAVLLWSLGFGLLGGRVVPLSVPLRRA